MGGCNCKRTGRKNSMSIMSWPCAGGVFTIGDVRLAGSRLQIRRCQAITGNGGAIWALSGSINVTIDVEWQDCEATTGDAVFAAQNVTLSTAIFAGKTRTIVSGGSINVRELRCWRTSECSLRSLDALQVGSVTCPRGTGYQTVANAGTGCFRCPEGTTRLDANSSCQVCPNIPNATVGCHPSKLEIPAGFMVPELSLLRLLADAA